MKAILLAGGPINWKANTGNVELARINKNGSASLRRLKLDLRKGTSEIENPRLQDSDIINVKTSTIGNITEGIGTIASPARDFFSIFALYNLLFHSKGFFVIFDKYLMF